MRGASDDLKPESIVVYVQGVYIGVADRGVAMWRGWGVLTTNTKEGESGGVHVGGVGELVYGLWLKIAKNSRTHGKNT